MESLSEDIVLYLLEYLYPRELYTFSTINHYFHRLACHPHLWFQWCQQKWNISLTKDAYHLYNQLNYQHLYLKAWPICKQLKASNKSMAISDLSAEYGGKVGVSNQTVMAMTPFPALDIETMKPSLFEQFLHCFLMLRRDSDKNLICKTSFSTPYLDMEISHYDVQVRNVAYYEITIQAPVDQVLNMEVDPVPACVAIGLATVKFNDRYMPGWDNFSYGYHSDDGAIFHGKGLQLSLFGPKYGIGDTVGCGILYSTRTIFFTLNGKFLGQPFHSVEGQFYPVVGIDANVKIDFNFGAKPFAFSIRSLMNDFVQ